MKVIVFFTYGVSLKKWKDHGLLEREIRLYNTLKLKGIDITFVTYGDDSDLEYQDCIKGIKIVPFYKFVKRPNNKFIRVFHSLCLPFVLKSHIKDGDLLKTKQVLGGWNAVLSKYLHNLPLMLRCGFEPNSFASKQKLSMLYRLFVYVTSFISYSCADKIVAATEEDKSYISSHFLVRPSKIDIFPNWVDLDIFSDRSTVSEHTLRAVTVCRLAEQKNLFNTIDAFDGTGIHLDIIGGGALQESIAEYITQKKSKVTLLGKIDNHKIPDLLAKYPVFLLCSHYEGNPKSLLEAMACGKIIIATQVPGIEGVIEHEKNGLLSAVDSDSIRENLVRVYKELDSCRKLGRSASQLIKDHYSLDILVERELKLYSLMISR